MVVKIIPEGTPLDPDDPLVAGAQIILGVRPPKSWGGKSTGEETAPSTDPTSPAPEETDLEGLPAPDCETPEDEQIRLQEQIDQLKKPRTAN